MPIVGISSAPARSPRPIAVPTPDAPAVKRALAKPARVSFGGTAAIVTSMALITGLAAADASKGSVLSALLIAAVADNLTDSLSVHLYQESEGLEQREAFFGTISNFATRLVLCLTFALIVVIFGVRAAAGWGTLWGMALLSALSYVVARKRRVSPVYEIGKHLAVAVAVMFVSRILGLWIAASIH